MKVRIGCSICGKEIKKGNSNGVPNGFGFTNKKGELLNICSECVSNVGAMSKEEKEKFFNQEIFKNFKGD